MRECHEKSFKLSSIAKIVCLSIAGLGVAQSVVAATIEVTSNLDDNGFDCTLRQAMVSINNATSAGLQGGCVYTGSFGTSDSITFSDGLSDNTIMLQNGQLEINSGTSLSIKASNTSGNITLDGNQDSRVIFASSATLSIDSMIITGGSAGSYAKGGGIYADTSFVTLSSCSVVGNVAYSAAGVYASNGTLEITDSTVSGNSSVSDGGGLSSRNNIVNLTSSDVLGNSSGRNGGGIETESGSVVTITDSFVLNNSATNHGGGLYNSSSSKVTIVESTVSNNSAASNGGSIFNTSAELVISGSTLSNSFADYGGSIRSDRGELTMLGSTISGNTAYKSGGGVVSITSVVIITNSTLSGNFAEEDGGALLTSNPFGGNEVSAATLINSTVSGNHAGRNGGGLIVFASNNAVSITNSIVANSSGADCYLTSGLLVSDLVSIIEDGSCATNAKSIDPMLYPLADNGGKTFTHALKENSPARDMAVVNDCPVTDQRDENRFSEDALCDVGAIEFNSKDVLANATKSNFYVIPLENGKVVVVPL